MRSLRPRVLATAVLLVLLWPRHDLRGAGWAPGERLPPLILSEINRRIAGNLRVQKLSWKVPDTIVAEGLTILDPEGQRVASAERLEAVVNVGALAGGTLHVLRAPIVGLKLSLVVDAKGLNLARAFKTRAARSDDAPLAILLEQVSTQGASVLFKKDEVAVAAAGLGLDGSLRLADDKLSVEASAQARRLAVQVGEFKVVGDELRLASLSLNAKGLSTPRLEFLLGGEPGHLAGSIAWDHDGAYDLTGEVKLPAGYWPEGLARPDLQVGPLRTAVRMRGALARPLLDLALQPVDVQVAGTWLRQTQGSLHIDRERLHSEDLQARLAGGSARGSASLRFKEQLLDATLELGGAALAELSRVPSLKGLVDGTVTARGPLGDGQALGLELAGRLRRFEFGALVLREAHELRGRGTLLRDKLKLDEVRVRGPSVELRSSGQVLLTERELNLAVVATSESAAGLLREPVQGLEVAGLKLSARASGAFARIVLAGQAQVARAALGPLVLSNAQAQIDLDAAALRLDAVRGELAGGLVEGQAEIGLDATRAMRGSAQLASARLETLWPGVEGLQGQVDLAAVLGGTVQVPRASWTAVGKAIQLGGGGPYRALLDGELRERRVQVQGVRAWPDGDGSGEPWLQGHAALDLESGALDGALELGPAPLDALPYLSRSQLSGSLRGEFSLAGDRQKPALFGRLRVDGLQHAGTAGGVADAVVCLRQDTLQVELSALGPEVVLQPCRPRPTLERSTGLNAQLRLQLGDKALQLALHAREVPLALLLSGVDAGRGLDGPIDADAELGGTLDRPLGALQLRTRRLLVDGKAAGGVVVSGDLDGRELRLALRGLDQFEGYGLLNFEGEHLRGDALIHLRGFAPDPFVAALRERGGSGRLDGTLQLRYDASRQDALEVDAHLEQAQVLLPPARPILLVQPTVAHLAGSRLTLRPTQLQSGDSRFTLAGTYDPEALALSLEGDLALAVLKLFTPEVTAADGSCAASLEVGGSVQQPRVRGHLTPQPGATVTLRSLGKPIGFTGGELRFTDDEVRAQAFALQGLGGEAVLEGRVLLAQGQIARYDLRARADNVMLRLDRVRGEINADLALVGEARSPRLQGSLEIVEGRFRERYRLSNFIATAATVDDGVTLAQRVPQLAGMVLDLQITGSDLRANADMGSLNVDVSGSTDLRLGGTLEDPSLSGVIDVTEGVVTLLSSRLDVETASVDFQPRPDRRLVPRIELHASSVIEPAQSPTGAELPVELSLEGDLERMQMDVTSDESGERLSRAELLSLLATGRSLGALLNETSRDAAVRLVSRELLGDVERQVEGALQQLVGSDESRSLDLVLESGSTGARTGLRWDADRRLQFEGETSVSYFDVEDPTASDSTIAAGTLRHAVRGRLLLSDNLPLAESVALEASAANLSFAANVYSTWDLKLTMRIFEL